MKKNPFFDAAALLVALSPVHAAAPTFAAVQLVLAKNNCLACHAVEAKLVGPAYQDVARKYHGRADAAAYLSKKIKGGSAGVWGPVQMPPNARVSDADLQTIVGWLIAGAPSR